MRINFIEIAKCPLCNSDKLIVEQTKKDGEQIIEGKIQCASCHNTYPILDGIPIFLDVERQKALLKVWNTSEGYSDYMLMPTTRVRETLQKHTTNTQIAVDAGCGSGAYTQYFASKEIICVDLVPYFLKKIRNDYHGKAKLSLVIADIRALPLKNKTVDILFCSEVLEHLEKTDFDRTVESFTNICQKTLLIDIPNESNFTVDMSRRLFTKLGFYKSLREDIPDEGLYHHCHLGMNELRKMQFSVHGCISWVSVKNIPLPLFWKLYDAFVWNIPELAGMVIGIKEIN